MKYYDRSGTPMSIEEWTAMFESSITYRIVKQTELGDGRRLSTVWLGLDHSFGRGGPPLIFETMLFPDGDMERWATEDDARAGHDAWLARLERGDT